MTLHQKVIKFMWNTVQCDAWNAMCIKQHPQTPQTEDIPSPRAWWGPAKKAPRMLITPPQPSLLLPQPLTSTPVHIFVEVHWLSPFQLPFNPWVCVLGGSLQRSYYSGALLLRPSRLISFLVTVFSSLSLMTWGSSHAQLPRAAGPRWCQRGCTPPPTFPTSHAKKPPVLSKKKKRHNNPFLLFPVVFSFYRWPSQF